MLRQRFFVQVFLLTLLGQVFFAAIAIIAWQHYESRQLNRNFDHIATQVAELVLPERNASRETQQNQLERVSKTFGIDLTLYDIDQPPLSSQLSPLPLTHRPLEPGRWIKSDSDPYWATLLSDGRSLVIDVSDLSGSREGTIVTAALIVMALFVAALLYPLIRRLTGRLEHLQRHAERVANGDLSARVTIRGKDEVAKLAASFNHASESVEALIERQRLLLANTSHELRTPLARLRMRLELLERKPTPERFSSLTEDIAELDGLIDDLITLTRYESVNLSNRFQTVDLFTLATEECERINHCSCIGEPALIRGEDRMLRQVLQNLINNALTHGKPPIRVNVEIHATEVVLSVTDAGPGISMDDTEHLFEPFVRGKDKQNVPGYGLGLAIVSQIVQLHGGTISIDREPESTITIRFTAAEQ